jgi:uncharacterized protein (DUF488 family)
MEVWLPDAGVEYQWDERLGGRRHGAADSPNVGLRNASFRAYADYMATTEFQSALLQVIDTASDQRVAVMCAESLWWNCHRRLIADAAALLHRADVVHVMHDRKTHPHVVTDHATVSDDTVKYPGEMPTLL